MTAENETISRKIIAEQSAENYRLRSGFVRLAHFIEKMKHVEYFIDTAGDEYKYDIDDQLDEILEKIKSIMECINEI